MAVTLVCSVIVGLLLLGAATSLIFDDVHLVIPTDPVCVTDTATSGSTSGLDGSFGAHPGVEVTVDGPRYCLDGPNTGQRALYLTGTVASLAWHWGAFAFALLLIRRARRRGPFTEPTVRGLHAFGWYLSAGSALLFLTKGVIGGLLLRDMKDGWGFALLLDVEQLPWMAIFTGVGLISFARLMRVATTMREDLEGVV
jgi:hypothetical protein